jgi:Ca-activated chloride channel family protein
MSAEPVALLTSTEGAAIPLQGVSARGRLRGLLFELTVEQSYANPSDRNVEAVYTFPLPHCAVFLGLEVDIGGRTLAAKAVRTDRAHREYEQALDRGDSAVLLEQAADGLYTASLGNLMAGERAVIRYRYAELLAPAQGVLRLAIPTVIAPRFGQAELALQPHQVPGVEFTAAYPFALAVEIEGALAAAPVECPTHRVSVEAGPGRTTVTLMPGAELDRDFVLLLPVPAGAALPVTEPDADGHVALASFTPDLPTAAAAPVALELLVDCSGSMAGDSIAQARRALRGVLDRLGEGDRVSLTRFGSSVDDVTRGLVPATPERLASLRRQVAAIDADLGGTLLPEALHHVVNRGAAGSAVLLVTDGEVWAIEQALGAVARAGHRLFVVAVGSAPVESLARLIAEHTGGACEFVTPGEDVEAAVLRMARRIREPVWTLRDVRWPSDPQWAAPLPPALFSGDTVHLLAGFGEAPAGEVELVVGDAEGRQIVTRVPLAAAVSEAGVLARVAAARRLAALEPEAAAGLAERYQLASHFTAFVVTVARAAGEQAQSLPELRAVPQMLAAGWGATAMAWEPQAMACRRELCGASPGLDDLDMAAVGDACDMPASSARLVSDLDPGFLMRAGERAESLAIPVTLDPATVGRLLEAVGRGWVPADFEELLQHGCPLELTLVLQFLARLEGVEPSEAVVLWLALLARSVEPQRLDPPASPRYLEVLSERQWRELRRAYREQMGELLSA